MPDDAVGLVGQHQVEQTIAIPIDQHGIGVAHIVPVIAAPVNRRASTRMGPSVEGINCGSSKAGTLVVAPVVHQARPAHSHRQ